MGNGTRLCGIRIPVEAWLFRILILGKSKEKEQEVVTNARITILSRTLRPRPERYCTGFSPSRLVKMVENCYNNVPLLQQEV